jgi:enoyl-CoA hydratase
MGAPLDYETILVETHGGVGLIRLNRPKALNALSARLIEELNTALAVFESAPEIGALVLTGSERAFASGADITEMQAKTSVGAYLDNFLKDWEYLSRVRKPVIAAVSGFALGGGCELAMMCDIILAAENAVFGQPEVKLGIMPGAGGTQRLTRAIGKARAMLLCLTGELIDAPEAERCGLVSKVVPLEQLEAEALALAATIAAMSRPAILAIKESINRADEAMLGEGMVAERRLFYGLLATEDHKEGMAAFLEKRAPEFKNR